MGICLEVMLRRIVMKHKEASVYCHMLLMWRVVDMKEYIRMITRDGSLPLNELVFK